MKVSIASGVGPDTGPGDTESLPLPTCIKNPTPRDAQNKVRGWAKLRDLPRRAYSNHQIPLLKRTQGF